jgi:hypothetical protein
MGSASLFACRTALVNSVAMMAVVVIAELAKKAISVAKMVSALPLAEAVVAVVDAPLKAPAQARIQSSLWCLVH